MSAAYRQDRRLRGVLLTLGVWLLAATPLLARDRAETPRADAPGAPVAAPVARPLVPALPVPGTLDATALDASSPLPGGSVPWTALVAPPAFGGGGLLLQGGGPAPQLRYYAVDALGSVRVVFDATGGVVSRADYEPFGAAVPASTTGTLPRQQYTGHERDGEVGVDYFGARMYTPTLGRMPSVDPLYAGAMAQPQRWNRYAYALNNPLSITDPDGRKPMYSTHTEDNCGGTCFPSEHPIDLFLWEQYREFCYFCGGGGTGIDISEWDYTTQKPKVAQQVEQDQQVGTTTVLPPTIIGTTDEIKVITEVITKVEIRLKRKPSCGSALNGPLATAEVALATTTWRVSGYSSPNGMSLAVTTSKAPSGNVLINRTGSFFSAFQPGTSRPSVVIPGLSWSDSRQAVILHEIGHVTDRFGPDTNPETNNANTRIVVQNCF